MTEPIEAAKAKACELANSARISSSSSGPYIPADCLNSPSMIALATFIQQVSDAAKTVSDLLGKSSDGNVNFAGALLTPFILPEPVDPLADVLKEAGVHGYRDVANDVREALAKHGLKIVEASHDG